MSDDPAIEHGVKLIEPGLRMHYALSGKGPHTAVLIHGFPETWHQWRHVIPELARAGWRVVAVDYRGAGNSSKPVGGYDKRTMAGDIRNLLQNFLGIKGQVAVVGHDIGAMVGYAYAAFHRDEVTHLSVLDSVIPGTEGFAKVRAVPRVWHFAFHAVPDLPEMLVHGREREYIRHMVELRICDPSKFDTATMEAYAYAYSSPGAMRAAFDVYRAFERDIADNQANLRDHGKLKIPVQTISGGESPLDPVMGPMMREVAERVISVQVPGCNHWLSDEKPSEVSKALLGFLGSH